MSLSSYKISKTDRIFKQITRETKRHLHMHCVYRETWIKNLGKSSYYSVQLPRKSSFFHVFFRAEKFDIPYENMSSQPTISVFGLTIVFFFSLGILGSSHNDHICLYHLN